MAVGKFPIHEFSVYGKLSLVNTRRRRHHFAMRIFQPNLPKQRSVIRSLCGISLCYISTSPLAAPLLWTAGGFASNGDYGNDSTTEIVALPVAVKWRSKDWTLKANTAWIQVSGPGTVDSGGTGRPVGHKEQGLGDTFLSASLRSDAITRLPSEVTARVKVPTGRASQGLGTGAADFELRADLFKAVGASTLFGGLGYRWRGDADWVALNNTASATAGLDARVASQLNVGGFVSGAEATSDVAAPSLDINVYTSLRGNANRSYVVYALKGLRNGSPDWGVGVQVGW